MRRPAPACVPFPVSRPPSPGDGGSHTARGSRTSASASGRVDGRGTHGRPGSAGESPKHPVLQHGEERFGPGAQGAEPPGPPHSPDPPPRPGHPSVTCMLRFDVLLVFKGVGEGPVTGAALEGRELGRSMVLSSKHVWVVGPIVVPQAGQLLKAMWQASGLKCFRKLEGSQRLRRDKRSQGSL